MENRGTIMTHSGSGTTAAAGVTNSVYSNAGTVTAPSVQNKNVKVIKRYQNRKLYDTHQSCYVTLDEIAEMIMRSEEVTVIDNRSKRHHVFNAHTDYF
ncbi:MAG: polyhydroxyalkanoate synthesis regulator DNA-binding domain-containing protein [Bdellovibrionota bacterium]